MQRDQIPPGALYLLILKTLAHSGELRGYEIAKSIQRISNEQLAVELSQFERVIGAVAQVIEPV